MAPQPLWSYEPTVSLSDARRNLPPTAPGPRTQPPLAVAGLVFDMGGVLYDDTLWGRWLLRVLRQLGVRTNYRSFFRLWDRDFLAAVQRGECPFVEAFRAFMRSAGLPPAEIEEIEIAARTRRSTLEAVIRPLPGVKTTLARLRQAGFVLGALNDSEHPAATLVQRLERVGLGATFSTVTSSFDLRRTRPDPVCYRTALSAMNLPAQQVAFVGHDPEELAGAAAVGMPTVAFNYDPDAQADRFIARFEELADLVESCCPRSAAA